MKSNLMITIFILIMTFSLISGCINPNQNENIKNSNINDLDLILTSNQNYYKNNISKDLIVNISLKNKKSAPVYIEKEFDFKYTLKYEISGISNNYFEKYEGPLADYNPVKRVLKPNDEVKKQFILMNNERFDRIFSEVGQETFGNYTFKVTYNSSFTNGTVYSNVLEFEILK